jgi:hypothetical protein
MAFALSFTQSAKEVIMPLADVNEIRLAIEDARARHAAVVALIYFTDTQAMGLLRLYATLALATASGGTVTFTSHAPFSRSLALALAAATMVLVVGAAFCLRAMRSGVISLPGRPADFWLWAMGPDVNQHDWSRKYLDNLAEKASLNEKLNAGSARALQLAKFCALILPIATAAGGAAGIFL